MRTCRMVLEHRQLQALVGPVRYSSQSWRWLQDSKLLPVALAMCRRLIIKGTVTNTGVVQSMCIIQAVHECQLCSQRVAVTQQHGGGQLRALTHHQLCRWCFNGGAKKKNAKSIAWLSSIHKEAAWVYGASWGCWVTAALRAQACQAMSCTVARVRSPHHGYALTHD